MWDNPERYVDKKGSIDNDKIWIGNIMYPIDELQNLAFTINGFHGQQIGSPFLNFFKIDKTLHGTYNAISFKYKEQKTFTFIYIKSEKQIEGLRNLFAIWYEQKVQIHRTQ